MRTLELVQPIFTSFEFWDFFGFPLSYVVEGAPLNKTRKPQMHIACEGSKNKISGKKLLKWSR